jgi:hypothetical protein
MQAASKTGRAPGYRSIAAAPDSGGAVPRPERIDDFVHAGLGLRDRERLLQVRQRSRVIAHGLVVLDRPPRRVHRDLRAVDAAMKGGGNEARGVADRRLGRRREQVHEPALVRGLDREDAYERDELGVLRDRGHRSRHPPTAQRAWRAPSRFTRNSRLTSDLGS